MNRAATIGVLLLVSSLLAPAQAHQPSESYLRVRPAEDGGGFTVRWDIALLDLEYAVGLDGDGDGAITWGEVKNRRQAVADYALAHLSIAAGQDRCSTTSTAIRADAHGDGHYAVLDIDAACPSPTEALEVDYSLLFELDPTHRGLLVFEAGEAPVTAMLSPGERVFRSDGPASSTTGMFTRFVGEGIRHIVIGYDHIAFVVLLLLPAGLVGVRTSPKAQPSARIVALDALKVVTAFTIAHSITLGLAAAGVVVLPVRLVESAIAASVVVAALTNLWPPLHGYRWSIAFVFGLVHGFGFANVLGELDLHGAALALPLAGFNIGVELGQVAIAATLLPLLLVLRPHAVYRRWIIPGASIAVALLASYWLFDRLSS